ncbi:hypothetical protein E4U43_005591, partial [Claviceps pusilla]
AVAAPSGCPRRQARSVGESDGQDGGSLSQKSIFSRQGDCLGCCTSPQDKRGKKPTLRVCKPETGPGLARQSVRVSALSSAMASIWSRH